MEKVVVAITTYNLDRYIAQALESILMQKTSFPFRIFVADDCSTDDTLSILYDYERKYPDIVKVFPSKTNLGSLANSNRLFDGLDAEYFSFLDGDDYWLDEHRLQKQVDFLDSHPEFSMCGANTYLLKDGVPGAKMIADNAVNQSYGFEDFAKGQMPYVHTSSILLRNTIFTDGLPDVFYRSVGTFEECALRGEDFRRILHLQQGPIFVMEDCFSVYRIHPKGIWQGSSSMKKQIEGAISNNFLGKYFDGSYAEIFQKNSEQSFHRLISSVLFGDIEGKSLSGEEAELMGKYIIDYFASQNIHPRELPWYKKIYVRLLRRLVGLVC